MFTELENLLEIKNSKETLLESHDLNFVKSGRDEYPIIGFTIGSRSPEAHTFGIFGGVHGLERVGTHIVITFLKNVLSRLTWDQDFRESFKNFRIVSIPLVNPGGMANYKRSNPQGVDLMRNAPIEKEDGGIFLVSGHRYGGLLP